MNAPDETAGCLDDVLRAALGARLRTDEPIGAKTTYRVGGRAAYFVEIDSEEMLTALGHAVESSGVRTLVLGGGSNTLVADEGFDGLCVTLGEHFSSCSIDAESATVEAGGALSYPVLARRCAAASLSGMEWAVGIPGTVGGAVAMNAGGHGSETKDHLLEARIVDLSTGRETIPKKDDLDLSYRSSSLTETDIVVSAAFRLESGEQARSEAEIAEVVRWRREHQPGGRNGGSVFSNPPGDSAGRLIEAAGLKGRRIGTAEVSAKHANFFLVDDEGSANDVFALIELVRDEVSRSFGVELSTELRLVGFAP